MKAAWSWDMPMNLNIVRTYGASDAAGIALKYTPIAISVKRNIIAQFIRPRPAPILKRVVPKAPAPGCLVQTSAVSAEYANAPVSTAMMVIQIFCGPLSMAVASAMDVSTRLM